MKPKSETEFRRLLEAGLDKLGEERLAVREIGKTGYYVIDSENKDTPAIFSPFFPESGKFESIQADPVVTALEVPLEAEYRAGNLWGLQAIHAEEAWDFGTGSSDVVAAVVDSGIDRKHADLARNTWKVLTPFTLNGKLFAVSCAPPYDFGFDAIDGTCTPTDRDGHGTEVSGIIGADGKNNGKFVVGVNWSIKLLPVVLLDENRSGCASRAAAALEFVQLVKARGIAPVRVVNLSWGMVDPSDAVKEQLEALAGEDVVIVAAAGNRGCAPDTKTLYPAAYKTVSTLISVGATNQAGDRAAVSNCDNAVIDIGAPGEDIKTTAPLNRVLHATGTSMATAFVTGAVALLASQCPELHALELKNLILDSAERRGNLGSDFIEGRFLDLKAAARACRAMR